MVSPDASAAHEVPLFSTLDEGGLRVASTAPADQVHMRNVPRHQDRRRDPATIAFVGVWAGGAGAEA